MGIALEAYKKIKVGEAGSMSAGGAGLTLHLFQSVVEELEDMAQDGQILITQRHRESQTGHRLIDLISFTRLA